MILETPAKGSLLTAGIVLVSLGADQARRGEVVTGIVLIAFGLALLVAYTYIVEAQAAASALRDIRLEEAFRRGQRPTC